MKNESSLVLPSTPTRLAHCVHRALPASRSEAMLHVPAAPSPTMACMAMAANASRG